MPSVDKRTLRELSLTSSFVAGGAAYHFHSGSLIGFFRFEGFPGGTEGYRIISGSDVPDDWNKTVVNPPHEKDGSRKKASAGHAAANMIFDSSLTLTGVSVHFSGSSESATPF